MVLKATAFAAVAAAFGIFGWVGHALATATPPRPVEEIEQELKEI
ncbi:MAG: hypothetical protein OWQ51_00900 [Pyrobaculum arsenaticum]|nr:hypothetical protein [Pyrobaculum arsenaticum]MCY0889531.1 hypothetical protein [Pyrobaculum arsenaticum]